MTCSIGSPKRRSARRHSVLAKRSLLFPGAIASIEAFAVINKLESPPPRHARQLPPAQAIALSSCRCGGKEVEEVEYNLFAGLGIDAEGYEGVKGVSREVGVCGAC
jgi:hypothetical protein